MVSKAVCPHGEKVFPDPGDFALSLLSDPLWGCDGKYNENPLDHEATFSYGRQTFLEIEIK